MPNSLSLVDILFLVTVVILVFNGFKNGAVFSLFNLLSLPIAVIAAITFGPQFVKLLVTQNITIVPLAAYIIIFFAAVFVLHLIGTALHGIIKNIPVLGFGDEVAGAAVGFVEAWLLWVILLIVLHNFLQNAPNIQGVTASQIAGWQQFYNDTIGNSLFARVNSFIVPHIPVIKTFLNGLFV